MKNFSTILLVMFVAMFWIFRLIVAFMHEIGQDLGGIAPFNQQMEIILLFVVLLCMILIVKRKIVGALIYLVAYGLYFGTNLMSGVTTLLNQGESVIDITLYTNMFISLLGVALPIAVLLDLLLDKNRKAHPKDKKTDWFYKNLMKGQIRIIIEHFNVALGTFLMRHCPNGTFPFGHFCPFGGHIINTMFQILNQNKEVKICQKMN